jgi:hypothetical protein
VVASRNTPLGLHGIAVPLLAADQPPLAAGAGSVTTTTHTDLSCKALVDTEKSIPRRRRASSACRRGDLAIYLLSD